MDAFLKTYQVTVEDRDGCFYALHTVKAASQRLAMKAAETEIEAMGEDRWHLLDWEPFEFDLECSRFYVVGAKEVE